MVECIVHGPLTYKVVVYLIEDEVDMILKHLPSGKNLAWDNLTIEVFKRYSNILKGSLALMIKCWDFGFMSQGWKVDLIISVTKMASLYSFHQ